MHITETTTVAEVASTLPSSVRVFQRYGLDFCCGGKSPLATVCPAGGVPLAEVDASTLESRVAPGLWLCGEMLDVEGRLGGFNFQWSWSSGTVAGRSAGRRA